MAESYLTGAVEFENALKLLEKKVSKKIVRKAVRKGMKPVLKRAKSNAKTMVGGNMGDLIAANLKIRSPKKQKRGQFLLTTRVVEHEQFVHINQDGRRHFIPAAIEFGHGDNKEQIALPYMRNASDTMETKAVDEFKKEMKTGIETAVSEATSGK